MRHDLLIAKESGGASAPPRAWLSAHN